MIRLSLSLVRRTPGSEDVMELELKIIGVKDESLFLVLIPVLMFCAGPMTCFTDQYTGCKEHRVIFHLLKLLADSSALFPNIQ